MRERPEVGLLMNCSTIFLFFVAISVLECFGSFATAEELAKNSSPVGTADRHSELSNDVPQMEKKNWVEERFKMPVTERTSKLEPSGPKSAWILVQSELQSSEQEVDLLINHRRFGPIKGREKKTFEVMAGENEVAVTTDFLGSNALVLSLEPGDKRTVVIGCNLKGWKRKALSVYYHFKNPSSYFYVKAL